MNLRRRLSGYFSSVGVSAVPLPFVLCRIALPFSTFFFIFFFALCQKQSFPGAVAEGGEKKNNQESEFNFSISKFDLVEPIGGHRLTSEFSLLCCGCTLSNRRDFRSAQSYDLTTLR